MKTLLLTSVAAACALTLSTMTWAGTQNDVPSCYAANKLNYPTPVLEHEIFVLIDQTTILDEKLQQSVRDNVANFARPGNAFVIAQFSAFAQGRYMDVLNAGTIETPLPEKERNSISVKVLKTFDVCMQAQQGYAAKTMATALNKAMQTSSDSLARSDVMSSLKDISHRVKQSAAKEKIVLVVSDMLENSSVSSFYHNKNVRGIDPAKELTIAEKSDQLGDFGGARVFVVGAGIIPEIIGTKTYRDPKTMAALKTFWHGYFQKSHATLAEFGAPALMVPVR